MHLNLTSTPSVRKAKAAACPTFPHSYKLPVTSMSCKSSQHLQQCDERLGLTTDTKRNAGIWMDQRLAMISLNCRAGSRCSPWEGIGYCFHYPLTATMLSCVLFFFGFLSTFGQFCLVINLPSNWKMSFLLLTLTVSCISPCQHLDGSEWKQNPDNVLSRTRQGFAKKHSVN